MSIARGPGRRREPHGWTAAATLAPALVVLIPAAASALTAGSVDGVWGDP